MLDLHSNCISKVEHLGCLTELRELHLHRNDWEGSVPEEIGNCRSLSQLHLSFIPRLRGALPASFGRLQELTHLYTLKSPIDNIDAVASCARLRELWAFRCGLTQFPQLAACIALEDLRLQDQEFDIQGEAPGWLAELPALKELVLPQNDGFSISSTLKQQLSEKGVDVRKPNQHGY